MKELSVEDWRLVQDSFAELVDLPPEKRETALQRSTLDARLTGEVRALLAMSETSGPLDEGLDALAGRPSEYSSLHAGDRIGAFRIERAIGRGGVGEVYLAVREGAGFAQPVALKLLRADSAIQMASIEAERRTLAGLEHPGIARLIDGGLASDGRPFVAMEYVEGTPLGPWCEANRPSLARRLAIFLELCDAVSYAHARLVIHRDVKPGNVMVQADGRARLLDFGIARILDESAPEQTLTLAMLTPEYAAPEQLQRQAQTTATDIFSLGALLFFLLTGRGPWQGEGGSLPATIRRMLTEDAPPPSRVASDAGPVPARVLRGDLDAIVGKAMRREPEARYASVADMAEDVRRYLAQQPVRARAGSRGYRLRRYLRRNWLPLSAAAALLGGIAATTWQAREAAQERDVAVAQTRKAEAINSAVLLMFRNAQEFGLGSDVTAGDLVKDNARRVLDEYRPDDPAVGPMVLALANLYFQLDDPASARTLIERAIARKMGTGDPETLAAYKLVLGSVLAGGVDMPKGAKLLDQADAFWASNPRRYQREILESHASRAQMYRLSGEREKGVALLLQDLPAAERYYANEPREMLIRYHNLAVHLIELNDHGRANGIVAKARTLARDKGLEQTNAAIAVDRLAATILLRDGKAADAERIFQRVVAMRRRLSGPSAMLAIDLNSLARAQANLNDPRAIASYVEADELSRQYLGAASPNALIVRLGLIEALSNAGKTADARNRLEDVRPLVAGMPDPLLRSLLSRAEATIAVGARDWQAAASRLDEAEKLARSAGPGGVAIVTTIDQLREKLAAARGRTG